MTAQGGAAAARRAALAVAAAWCLVLGCVVVAVGASSASPEAGYWWQPEPVSGLVPVPGVPANGMYVASSPSGPQAESAVRFPVSEPSGLVRLTLHVSSQERVGKPAVVAFPATSKWQSGGPQAWSARPSYRASARPSKGVFTSQGTVMTITFPAADAAIGMVLVPDSSGGASPSFTISFAPPRDSDVSVVGPSNGRLTPSATGSSTSQGQQPSPRTSRRTGKPSSGSPHPGTSRAHSPTSSGSTPASPGGTSSETDRPTGTAQASRGSAGHAGTYVLIVVIAVVGVGVIAAGLRISRRR